MCLLSNEERQRLSPMGAEGRLRFLAGRVLMRSELGRRLSLSPSRVPLSQTRWGKPFLIGDSGPLFFNLAHSGEHLLFASSSRSPVGVDVETTGRSPQSVIDRFNAHERSSLALLPERARPSAFQRLWAAKEACMKCRGRGSISSIPVTLDHEGRWQDVEWHRVEPSPDFLGVVAVKVG